MLAASLTAYSRGLVPSASVESDVNGRYEDGTTPLMSVSVYSDVEFVKLLLEYGADVGLTNRYGYAALARAVKGRHDEVVRLLLEHGADPNSGSYGSYTVLENASRDGCTEIVRLLLKHGAHIVGSKRRGYMAVFEATVNGHQDVVKLLEEAIAVQEAKSAERELKTRHGWVVDGWKPPSD